MKDKVFSRQFGFSLVELTLVVALLGVILTLATVNLFKPVSSTKIDSAASDIISIIREAQNKAMNTDTSGETVSSEYGVHFEANKYILFKGATFDPANPANFSVDVPAGITISANLPANNIIFQRISGEVVGFDNLRNTVCLTGASSSKSVLIRVNFVGVTDALQQACS